MGSNRVRWWQEAKFGLFVHWGLYSIPGRGEWVMYREGIKIKDYEKLLPFFRPRPGAARHWAKLARLAGMRYMVLTTKHHDGFCLFDSKLTDYTAVHSAARRDLVREYVEACRAENMRVGFYYSIKDWHHPNYPLDPADRLVRLEPRVRYPDKNKYQRYMLGQLRELLINYGKIDILWFDGRDPQFDGRLIAAEIRKLQPSILINNRLLGNEPDFITPEQMVPDKPPLFNGHKIPWETCHTMTGQSWGYCRYEQAADYRSASKLVQMLSETARLGGNFMLNVGPRPEGTLRPEESQRLQAIGQWMRRNGSRIYGRLPAACFIRRTVPAACPGGKAYYSVVKGYPVPVNADAEEKIWRKTAVIKVSQDKNFDASRERFPAAARQGYCAYTVRAMHAQGLLYVLVDVESPTKTAGPRAKYPFNCDAVRFLFAANTRLAQINYTPESFEISIDAAGNVWMPNETKFPGAVFRHAARPSKRGYIIMLALPLNMLRRKADDQKTALKPGGRFRFNVAVIQPSPPLALLNPGKTKAKLSKSWWQIMPPDYTPYGERHRVFWQGREGQEPMFAVPTWGIWRLEK